MINRIFGLMAKVDASPIPQLDASMVFKNGLNLTYNVVGIIAVAVIIYSGFQFLTSNGDTAKTKKAIQTIIYAVTGLIIVLTAYAITNFVLTKA